MICKTYLIVIMHRKIDLKIDWSVNTPLHRHKGVLSSSYGLLVKGFHGTLGALSGQA